MRAKELIEKLNSLEDDTEIYVIDGLGTINRDITVTYDEDENTAGIVDSMLG